MVQYNYLDDKAQINFERIKYASDKGMGIFVMEPLKGGILAGQIPKNVENVFKKANSLKSNAQWSFEWILNQSEITYVFSGMNTMKQVKENLNITKNIEPNSISNEDLKTIGEVRKIFRNSLKINCATCGYCMPRPQGVDIPMCMKLYNDKYLFNESGLFSKSSMKYVTSLSGAIGGEK